MAMTLEAYARQLKQLLPPGKVWSLDTDSHLSRLALALAEEFLRVDNRGAALLDEADPRTAVETLSEWERMLGLPDEVVQVIPATVEGRRRAIISKMEYQGGQARGFFVALAAAAGYVATVYDDYGATVARSGRLRSGQRVVGVAWAHAFRMTVAPPTGIALSTAELERLIRRAAPSHTAVIFVYI